MSQRRTNLPDARRTPRFAGICTFCRFPVLEPADPPDWALFGVPFDSGVTFRPGARFAPRAIRDASQYVKPYSIPHDIDISEWLSLADAGDAPVDSYNCERNAQRVLEFARSLPGGSTTRLLAVGGDHSIAYANIRATWERQGSPGSGLPLLHFDSHLDTVDQTLGERWSHASPFIRAIEDNLIDPSRMLSIGIKGPLNTARDLEYAREHAVTILTCERLRREGARTIDRFLDALDDEPCYLTFDIDVIDPACAPGTGTPSQGGLSAHEALALLRRLAGVRIVGADVVEVLPDRDISQNTSLLAAHVMFEILCLDAVRRRLDAAAP